MTGAPLGAAGVVELLLVRGLFPPNAVDDGGVRVVDVSRRNRNHRVETRAHGSFLVKQAVSDATRSSLLTEAAMLAAIGAERGGRARHLARLLDVDREMGILVFALEPRVESLLSRVVRTNMLDASTGRAVGRALAEVQSARPSSTSGSSGPPGALLLHRPPLGVVRDAGPACMALLRIVQSDETMRRELQRLETAWSREGTVHGDLRWDNVLVRDRGGRGTRALLVDWELSGRGDVRWDAACFLASMLDRWVATMPVGAGISLRDSAALAGTPLERMRPGSRAFLREWGSRRSSRVAGHAAVTRLAAARLLQLAFESQVAEPRITAAAVVAIQLASNMLAGPDEAAERLFGIAC